MDDKIVDLKDFKKEQKRRKRLERKAKRKQQLQEVYLWCNENKELVCIIVPLGTGLLAALIKGGYTIIKGAIKSHNLTKQQQIKDLYCYDNRLGHYWKLRRELTNNEWLEIDKRKKNGETLADILRDLKVLA